MHRLPELEDRAQAVLPPVKGGCTAQSRSETEPKQLHLLAGAVAPPNLPGRLSLGGATSWLGRLHLPQQSGSEWVDPFGPNWVFQGPNCPKIKLMGSPPISNLIIVLTTINPKTISAACSGASITSSDEFPANFRRSSDEPSVMLLRTSGKLLDLRRSTWQVPTSFFG